MRAWGQARAAKGQKNLVFTLLLSTILAVTPVVGAAQTFNFTKVDVTGTQRVDPATIMAYANLPRGQAVSAAQLNDAYQRIVNSGLFESVEINPNGATLEIKVREYPTINRINIEGNRRLKDEDLAKIITSAPRRVYSPKTAEADAAAITDAYRQSGRLSATVTPRIIRRADNRIDLVFEVIEGGVVEIERVSFVGNTEFSDRRLRGVLATKQAGLLRQFIRSDTFIADRIAFDRQVLRDFYQSRGYIDFQVLSATPQLARDRGGVFITFNVQEGQQFRLGKIETLSEIDDIDPDFYQTLLKLKSGDIYNPAMIDRSIARLERQALAEGRSFVRVTPDLTRRDEDGLLDIRFVIERGERVFVERIDVEGNTTTLDRVVRRQFDIVEGDPFNPREIRQSAERIRALGFFSTSDIQVREGSSPDRVVLDVTVEEQPTGTLGFGGTYSVEDGFGAAVNLTERNFLGRGQTVALTFSGTSETGTLSASFIEPAFLGRDVAASIGIFNDTTNYASAPYQTSNRGIEFGLGFPMAENARLRVFAKADRADLTDIVATASPIIKREGGVQDQLSFGYQYSVDTRGVGLDPNTGYLLQFGHELVELGDGKGQLMRSTALLSAETKVYNEEVSLRFELEAGAITGFGAAKTRVTDRFFLRSRQLRGFESNGIGPRDLASADEDALGGNYYAVARFETGFPLGLPDEYGISGGLFFDVGANWGLQDKLGTGGTLVDDDFHARSVIGFSIFWTTPIGPLRFNFSRALVKEDYDRTTSFDFLLSTRF